jgi:hypothetical protein
MSGVGGSTEAGTATLLEAVGVFTDLLELPDVDPLYAVLGTRAALDLPGDPVWLLVIDGSSGGKTELVMPLTALANVRLCAHLTEASLLSGTSQRERATDSTGGVLRQVGARGAIVLKDFTSVLTMQRDTRAQTLAALREIHDGRWARPVGTEGGRTLTWAGKCALIAGCTEAWDAAHEVVSMMGDRFLVVRSRHDDRLTFGARALDLAGGEDAIRAELRSAVSRLFNSERRDPAPIVDRGLFIRVADLVTLARSPVIRNRKGEMVAVLAPEMPGRFVKGMAGLWAGLTSLGADVPTARRVVLRVAFDSIPRQRRTMLDILAEKGDWSESRPIGLASRLPTSTARRSLEDLHAHGLVDREHGGGNKGDRWCLVDRYRDTWTEALDPYTEDLGAWTSDDAYNDEADAAPDPDQWADTLRAVIRDDGAEGNEP